MEEKQRIQVMIADVNIPPRIVVDGIDVAVIEYEHKYLTSDQHSRGIHRYLIKYVDDNVIKVIGCERMFCDDKHE